MRSSTASRAPALLLSVLVAVTLAGCMRAAGKQTTLGALDALEETAAKRVKAGKEGLVGGLASGSRLVQASESVAGGATAGVVDVMVARSEDLGELSGALVEASTRVAVDEIGSEIDRALRESLVHPGTLSAAITAASESATRGAIDATRADVRAALAEACPDGASLRECVHREARALSGQVVAGALDQLRWPLRIMAGGLVLFTVAGCVVLVILMSRLLGAPRGGSSTRTLATR